MVLGLSNLYLVEIGFPLLIYIIFNLLQRGTDNASTTQGFSVFLSIIGLAVFGVVGVAVTNFLGYTGLQGGAYQGGEGLILSAIAIVGAEVLGRRRIPFTGGSSGGPTARPKASTSSSSSSSGSSGSGSGGSGSGAGGGSSGGSGSGAGSGSGSGSGSSGSGSSSGTSGSGVSTGMSSSTRSTRGLTGRGVSTDESKADSDANKAEEHLEEVENELKTALKQLAAKHGDDDSLSSMISESFEKAEEIGALVERFSQLEQQQEDYDTREKLGLIEDAVETAEKTSESDKEFKLEAKKQIGRKSISPRQMKAAQEFLQTKEALRERLIEIIGDEEDEVEEESRRLKQIAEDAKKKGSTTDEVKPVFSAAEHCSEIVSELDSIRNEEKYALEREDKVRKGIEAYLES